MNDMNLNNRKHNAKNPNQGPHKKVLCVCSAGLLRSPTAALVLSKPPFNYNTRAVGCVPEFALIPLDEVLLEWADEVICMSESHVAIVEKMGFDGPIFNLNIPDNFEYRNQKLEQLIKESYRNFLKVLEDE